MKKLFSSRYLIATMICLVLFYLFFSNSALASKSVISEIQPTNLILVYFFGDQNDGILAITPINDNIAIIETNGSTKTHTISTKTTSEAAV